MAYVNKMVGKGPLVAMVLLALVPAYLRIGMNLTALRLLTKRTGGDSIFVNRFELVVGYR